MDVDFSSWIALLSLFTFLATLFVRATALSESKSKTGFNLPPGPTKLPLIGHLHLFASFRPPHRTLADLAAKYGPTMHLQLGEITSVVVSSPEAAKEVLRTHDIKFAYRPSLVTSDTLCYKNTDIAFAPYGEYWRQLRKICTHELLSSRRVQSFKPIREEEYSNLCRWIASKNGSTINLTETVELSTLESAIRACLGKKAKDLTTLIALIREGADLAAGFYFADVYPSIKLFQLFSGMRSRLERQHKTSDAILQSIIDDHRVSNGETKLGEALVDVLLKFNDPGHELHLTDDNIKAVLQDLFASGIETSSTTVDWTMAEMLRHPRVLKKAQDEVRRIFNHKGFVDESYCGELKYLKLVIQEALRMHPPLPLLLPRENCEPCEVRGYKLPAKTRIIVNAWAIGRDPKVWDDPDCFMPERHLKNSFDYKGNNFEYIPFGAGRRICPGISFGLANIELPLAMLLFHFDWVLPDGMKSENVDMAESFGITARRKNPLYVTPIIKNPL